MINDAVSPEKLTSVLSPLNRVDKRMLRFIELCTLTILVAMVFWSVGPLIEEWGLFRAFNENGVEYLKIFAPSIPMRPLHLTAYFLQWLLGNGHPIGVTLVTALLLVIRYFIARWAVSPLLSGYERWVVAVFAATLVFWPGVWFGRYGSAQITAILFFVALGFSIRLYLRWSFVSAIGCAVSVALMLAMYQGLTLCLLAIPFASLLWRQVNSNAVSSVYSNALVAGRICIAIVAGFVIYGAYGFWVSSTFGNAGYEGALAADSARLLTISGLFQHIKSVYITSFFKGSHLLPLLLALTFFMCSGALDRLDTFRAKVISISLVFVLIFLLPLLGMIYVNVLHIGDVDRVLFPVSVGFVLVSISLLIKFRGERSSGLGLFNALIIFGIVLTSNFVVAHGSRLFVQLQKSVIAQTIAAADSRGAKVVLIKDETGVLGDVYTFLGPTLGDASTVLGRPLSADICTPNSVDRLHAVAQRFPITTTPRCEDLPPAAADTLTLTARWINGVLVVTP